MAFAAHKHTDLEDAMADLARAQRRTEDGLDHLRKLQERTEASIDRLAERQERTEANLDRYAADMRAEQADTKANLDRLSDEMRDFKGEMRASASRSEKEWKEFRIKLAEQSDRFGTLSEDIVAPSLNDVFRQFTGYQDIVDSAPRQFRLRLGKPGTLREFDGIACGGVHFLLVSVKSRLRPEYIEPFIETLSIIREYFPEAEGRKVVGAMAAFYIDLTLVTAGERRGLIMLGLSNGLVEALNSPEFKPKEF